MSDGPTGSADSRITSLEPGPNAGSPSSVTCHDSGSHSDDFASCVDRLRPDVGDAGLAELLDAPTSTVLSLDGKPAMRPHICPLPISFDARAARGKADDGFDVGLDGGAVAHRRRRLRSGGGLRGIAAGRPRADLDGRRRACRAGSTRPNHAVGLMAAGWLGCGQSGDGQSDEQQREDVPHGRILALNPDAAPDSARERATARSAVAALAAQAKPFPS